MFKEIPPLSSILGNKKENGNNNREFPMKFGQKESIIGTNDDAASCKLSCVNKGYYQDNFVKYFVKTPIVRPPLINRGFFSRVQAIEQFIQQFFFNYQSQAKQIVSLGCGFDTLYFRLKEKGKIESESICYFEVDYVEVVKNKIKIIKSHKELYSTIDANWDDKKNNEYKHTDHINSDDYKLGCIDLTKLDTFKIFDQLGIDYQKPTLFLSECVLVYIPTQCGNDTIQWTSKNFKESVFITYEQIKPNDEFGLMMLKNIENKGCPLLSVKSFPEIFDQKKRYTDLGYQRIDVLDMKDVYNKFIDKNRLKDTEKLEIFDEFEEWFLIQTHYCYILAIKSETQDLINRYHFEN